MKLYRKLTLAVITGSVSGTIYYTCKKDGELRKTVLKLAGASIAYTSVCFLTTLLIPRLKFVCYYFTLASFVTSANFLFTRQFLLEKEWLCRKQGASRTDLSKVSALAGAETGLVLEGILTEGGVRSTARAMGYWALVGLGLQFVWFMVEDWRVRRSLILHRPDLYRPPKLDLLGKSFRWLDRRMQGEWEIDRVKQTNKRLEMVLIRELDKLRQVEQVLEEKGVSYQETET